MEPTVTDEQQRRLRAAHSALSKWIREADRNGDGYLEVVELRNRLGIFALREAMREADRD